MKIPIFVAVIQHKHGQNVDVATSEQEALDSVAAFCRQYWDEEVNSGYFDHEDIEVDAYEKEHGQQAMINFYFECNNETSGVESYDITEHELEIELPKEEP